MKTKFSPIPDDLMQATTILAENLVHSEPLMFFQMSEKKFDADTQASSLLRKLSEAQASMRKRQMRKDFTEGDLEELRNLQNQVQSNQAIQDHENAQQAVKLYVQDINLEISSLVGFDFCSLARRSGCC